MYFCVADRRVRGLYFCVADRRVRGLYSCAAGFLFSRASGEPGANEPMIRELYSYTARRYSRVGRGICCPWRQQDNDDNNSK